MTERVIFMKKMKAFLCLLMSALMLFGCVQTALALQVEPLEIADDAAYNYRPADINNDGAVTSDDARVILRLSVNLERWEDVAKRCNYSYWYDYKSAADPDGDGNVTAADARITLRIAVGLQKWEDANESALSSKHYIIDFYTKAVNNVKFGGVAGYSTKAWQYIKDEECNIFTLCNGSFVKDIKKELVAEGDAKTSTYCIGSREARKYFPNFTLGDYSKVKSATCHVNATGNYVISIVMFDSDTTSINNDSFIYKVTDQHVTWKEDVEPVLAKSTRVKNWSGESVITKNFTITAEITPNGKFISLTHAGDAVISAEKLTVYELLLIPTTYENKTATVHTSTTYTGFDYSPCFKGFHCGYVPQAYGTIDGIGDYLGACIRNISNFGIAGYTKAPKVEYDSKNSNLTCIASNQISNYFKGDTVTTVKGSNESWALFPPFGMKKYDAIKTATCAVNEAGNYYIEMVFHDVDTTKSTKYNDLQLVTTDLIYFDQDVAPMLRDMDNVKAYDPNGTVTYTNFTIRAEVTPDDKIVSMTQEATVTISVPFIRTLLINHKDQKIVLKVTESYTGFTY